MAEIPFSRFHPRNVCPDDAEKGDKPSPAENPQDELFKAVAIQYSANETMHQPHGGALCLLQSDRGRMNWKEEVRQ